jgi:hypothetical protein
MGEILDVKMVNIPLANTSTDWQGDDVDGHLFPAPSAALGGGITILAAWFVNAAATSSGTSFSIELQNWGTAGTAIKASGGTIAAGIGGTADPFEASVPKAYTLSYPRIGAGEWIVANKQEDNSSDPTRGVIVIQYVMGQ